MPDPVTEPDLDSDPRHLRILRGLPEDTRSAEIVYRASGKLPGDRTVRRSAAEFAIMRLGTSEGYFEQKVDLADAERYLEEAFAAAYEVDDRKQLIAESVDVSCPFCEGPRHYDGKQSFVTGELGALGALKELSVDVLVRHGYTCRTCGSTAFFADGYLEHPLPGSN